ncbi:hypothetical protein DPMN_060078 [Dreissena polymorpha]|uniref:Vacuolar protein sorting-associated protein 41 homolog n=1 Tax=Dreissena polymorpha TaxID=45954 RepID=A0A9D4C4Y4_DREPO|nr:hypothetical protein DPMN_060078 [Dreissena polymorpha]
MATASHGEVQDEIKPVAESSDSEEGSEEGSDDSDEYDIEPQLRYDRISNDLQSILSKDCASCLAVDSKFLALGTHWGSIYILDFLGNKIPGKTYQTHTCTVNQISLDKNGDFVASCSDDGKVKIQGLYSDVDDQSVTFDRPVKSVALDPEYYKASNRKFVTGDDRLILNERSLFSRHKMTVLHQGEGTVRTIKWHGDFIAWSNNVAVQMYDMSTRCRITSISKDHNFRPDLHPCNLHWKDDRTLLVGWANAVKECTVKDRKEQDVRDLPRRYAEIVTMFSTTDSMVCGIASMDDKMVLLTYVKPEIQPGQDESKVPANRPNLRVVKPFMNYFEDISNDALSIRNYTTYRCNDYHLVQQNEREDNQLYIVSPRDIVVARPRDMDDHVAWLIEHEEFEEALKETVDHEKELKKHTFQEVGLKFIEYLLECKRYEDAAKLCVKVCKKNKALWEAQAYEFMKKGELKPLAPFIPREDPILTPAIYEMILNQFLQTDQLTFLQLVKEWPHAIYNVQTIIKAVLDKMDNDRSNKPLLQALAELHSYKKEFDKALAIYVRLKHKDVFLLINKYSLFENVSDKIVQLMEFDEENAVKMLMDNIDKIPIDKVVRQLEKSPKYLYVYLHKLSLVDNQYILPYAGNMVKLYAEFDPPKLLPFLKSSVPYPLDMALEEVGTRQFRREQVFLLGRMGNVKQALQLITDELGDVDHAIEFCKENNDQELWDDLIQHSLDKPNFIRGLLNNIGTHVDPTQLIDKIRTGMEIPGLRDSLVKILQDYNLQISLREGCKKILVADSFGLMGRLIKTQKKAISLETSHVCQMCQERILVTEIRHASDIVVFFCSHAVHEMCLPNGMETCPICTTQRRGPGSGAMFGK